MRTPDSSGNSCAVTGCRDRRRARDGRAARTARPTPGHLEQGGVIPELGSDAQPLKPGGGGARGGTGPSLMPSEEQLARAIGGGTQDALRDIDDGDETALNSKRWRSLRSSTASSGRSRSTGTRTRFTASAIRPGAVYGRRNRYTELRIQLKPDGRLSNVALAQPSGLEFLDDEAVEAFKEAEPFPNPPRQLIENGTINFGFGFLFDLNGPPQMRWFRYNY